MYFAESGFFLSQAEIGGIVGALLFLLLTVLLVVAGIIYNRRKQKPDKFGNVKYIGPADELNTRPYSRGRDKKVKIYQNGVAGGHRHHHHPQEEELTL